MLSWHVLGSFRRTAGGHGGVSGGDPQATQCMPNVLVASLSFRDLSVTPPGITHFSNIPPPQTPRSTTDPWQFPYMEPWPISV